MSDFGFSDVDEGDELASVKITGLETEGDLELDGAAVTLDKVVPKADIDDGKLTFAPATGESGSPYATFEFTVSDGEDESALAYTMTVNVRSGPNAAPTAADNTVTTDEDTAYAFAATDFGFSDADTDDELVSVKITTLETVGALALDGTDVEPDDVIPVDDIDADKLTFTPAANANGTAYATFGFSVSDGEDDSASTYTMTVDVTAVNDAPTAASGTVTTDEDTTYTFQVSDFGFSDVDEGDELASVKITGLETEGDLELDGAAVTLDKVVPKADIDDGKLTFAPATGESGSPYATFEFTVSDGEDESALAYTMTVNVRSGPNAAPTAADNTVTTDEDTAYAFAATDFGFSDADTDDELVSVKITTLETMGALALDGTDVEPDDVIPVDDIDAGDLTFTPAANANGTAYATFGFSVNDGEDDSASTYTMTVDVTAVNDAPTAANKTVTTVEDTPYVFTVADFGFSDVDEGDELASVKITGLETEGDLELDGVAVTLDKVVPKADIDAGKLTFAPASGESGSPYATFEFTVSDGEDESALAYTMTVDVTAAANNAATGQPAITGTAQAGRTLTAELGDIADNDGLPATAFPDGYAFRWVRVAGDGTETDIPGATEHTYRLQAEDAGGKVRVKVTFTDRDGTAEGPLASDPHPAGAATVLAAPVLRFGAARHRATEGGADATVTVRLDPGMPVPVTVALSATGQAGATAADWAGVPARLAFAAGERERSFTVTAVDDGDEDPGERMVLSFASLPEGVAAGEPATATVLLADDDAMIADGALRLVDGATADDGILEIWHAGEWGTVCDDRMDGASNVAPELACTLMGYRTGAMTGRRGTSVPAPEGQRIWLDDLRCIRGSDHWTGEPPGKLSDCWHAGWGLSNCGHEEDVRLQCASPQADGLSAADAEANETDRHLVFLVALLPAPTRRVTVDWETSDGTAVAGEDYVAARGTLAIGPGRTAGTVPVRLIDDDVEDDGETFTLTLSNASGAAIADATATGTIRNMEAGSAVPLTASFSGLPEAHDGGTAFGFTLTFSEEVEGVDAAALRGAALGVAGGRVTQAGPVTQGSARRWTVEVAPDGDGAVEITLPATRDCTAAGAVCTGEGRKLSQAVAATVPGPAEGALTASFSELPEAHDGRAAFTFTLTFSEDVEGLSYATLRDGAFDVAGGTVTKAGRQVRGSNRAWNVEVAPDGDDAVTVTLPETTDCAADGAVCAPDGRMLSEAVTATVPGPATDGTQALTASFSELPEAHDGAAAFTFELTFSEDVEGLSFRTLRDGAFDVTGGTVTRAKRHPPGTNLHWTIHVEPDGNGPVEVALPATADCADAGAVCTPDGRMLSNGSRARRCRALRGCRWRTRRRTRRTRTRRSASR